MKIGTAVKKITDALGIRQCDECKERQKKLDEWGERLARAIRGEEKCSRCYGTGDLYDVMDTEYERCPDCRGTGWVGRRAEKTPDRR